MDISLEKIVEIAEEAGQSIMEIYETDDFGVQAKEDNSPLTKADLAANKIITRGLIENYPDIPIMSEEDSIESYETRKDWDRFWCVDPLDGTKEFIKRNGEFTVNIALVESGVPVLGVIFAPALGVMYSSNDKGAWKESKGKREAIRVSAPDKNLIIVGSRTHHSPELTKLVERENKNYETVELISSGSSIKMCLVAEGSAHIYPRLGSTTMEWDTAAGHAIVVAAGGSFKDLDGSEFKYNKQNLLNSGFKASY
ncbi:MAG: 3'(2'), 5'-bisphosphate nucleotidase [Candidatus Paceibacteria bacterium]|jgi:3'(2'), 5'-bisphosphate nucleotidase